MTMTRRMLARGLILVLAAASCTEDNEMIYIGDGGLDGPAVGESGITSCTPGSFIRCQGTQAMLRCDTTGTGTSLVSCKPYSCDATLKRCTGCDPATAATCEGTVAVSCSSDGLPVRTTCSGGCTGGLCTNCTRQSYYRDADTDGYGNPAARVEDCVPPQGYVANNLDCDDLDPAAHPGQTTFYSVPTQGTHSFDYNCDKVEQKQHNYLAACALSGAKCIGEGWKTLVPACGKTGSFANCAKKGGRQPECTETGPFARVQACR